MAVTVSSEHRQASSVQACSYLVRYIQLRNEAELTLISLLAGSHEAWH